MTIAILPQLWYNHKGDIYDQGSDYYRFVQ